MGLENFFNMPNELMEYENRKRMGHEQGIKKMDIPHITFGQDISELLANSNEQNRLLTEQNRLLQEENERQTQQLIEAKQEKLKAEKRLKKERVIFWITFIIPTIISVLALIKG